MKLFHSIETSPAASSWKLLGTTPKHGICVPLFSLHTKNSCGIGEYLDLLPLISWCASSGFHILQLLPLNDTGEDSSPYNSISSIALNPLFLSLTALPEVHSLPKSKEKLQAMHKLCALPHVSYPKVKQAKWEFLREYYTQIGKASSADNPEFHKFIDKESSWLSPYALFRAIKHHMNGTPSTTWPISLTDQKQFPQLAKTFSSEIHFFSYLQFLCYQQLSQVRTFADQHQVFLMGDLPILISKDSCDVWYAKEYFSSSGSVGAPPDFYNAEGQNWQLPIYNIENLKKDNYIWWKERLRYAENFYSLYRLDHIVGFFRLWVWDSQGNGKFFPESPKEYLKQGTEILSSLLQDSSMLPIGEDLGDVPKDIKKRLKTLGICGTRIPRWEKYWESGEGFIPFDKYCPLSMTSLSTHDSDTLALWWNNSPSEAKEFASFLNLPYSSKLTVETQKTILNLSHQTASIFHINLLNDYLALCPELISKQLYQERINVPGTLSHTNWIYRVRPSIEELSSHERFNHYIKEILP
ncbi:4-alpha-glucanotransferase [Chlamydia pecorum MC/MarsBar]|uniref:4-alpha-glucanotransferase n=1 Tax=Chlamydia pecorum TaxID=85991 RepID=UPI0003D3FB47|nr:4-alpha-glucanotransferase [Chlamydia pecorum]ETF38287.1 4-alpha-glucanotransferase [Chlamydia pecorum MC/MarsBar]ETF40254.1 4-alpha-glucanotransferase [Chlamydia pecorum IPTaLE]UBV32272.1 4-alpha-glucanotransferase [Chlamydia pecorum]